MECKKHVESIISEYMATKKITTQFTIADAHYLCGTVVPILLSEPTLLRIEAPVRICGDIHGQLSDLLNAFNQSGVPPFSKWLFLGDYVDRGPKSVEVICFLLAMKLKYPHHIFLLRGNHESSEMTEFFGFARECEEKLNKQVWATFCRTFEALPLAAVINNKILCVHGGIGPDLKTLNQIAEIKRPLAIPTEGLVTDLLWSDPDPHIAKYGPNQRGNTVVWGLAPVQEFMKKNRLIKVIRGHQVAKNGYEYPFTPDESVVTVFTASNYTIDTHNHAAIMVISADLKCTFKELPNTGLASPDTARARTGARSDIEKRPTLTETQDGLRSRERDMIRRSSPNLSDSKSYVKLRNVSRRIRTTGALRKTNSTDFY